jgi:hypothetical protein
MWRRYSLLWLFVGLAASVCLIGRATAEILTTLLPDGIPGYDDDDGVTVQTRIHPEQMPLGLREGTILASPLVEQSTGYSSNALPGRFTRGSWELNTQASLSVSSATERTTLGAEASLQDTAVLDIPAQSHADGSVSAGGRFQLGQDEAALAISHITQHEDRSALDTIPSDRPIGFQVDDLRASYTLNQDRWSLTPALEISNWRYDSTTLDGVPASQAYRDRLMIQGSLTARYELAPLRSVLFVVRGLGEDYTHTPAGQPDPSSTSYQLLAGLSDQSDPLWHWRVLAGVEARSFDASAYRPRTTLIAEGGVSYTPSGLTTLSVTASRETDAAAQEGVSGLADSAVRFAIDHEWRRDILLDGWAAWQEEDFFSGGYQAGTHLGLGVTWVLNRSARLSVTYDQIDLRGSHLINDVPSPGYSRGLGLMTLRMGL